MHKTLAPSERAILLNIHFPDHVLNNDLEELRLLALSANAEVVAVLEASKSHPEADRFIGKGKLEELQALCVLHDPDVVIFNHNLSPSQVRNLEGDLKVPVVDRTALILDIFAQRAQTYEGKLQVELAQLEHLSTRLVRGWTHLERQKGGIGLRGPGETQLETDRRLIKERIKYLKERLEKVRAQRRLSRQARKKQDTPTLALVGYTNAGKSTLFNQLSHAAVLAINQLFATLDPTLRKIIIRGLGPCVLVDTVGFIGHLPHQLVDAFHATLEETLEATLLLHVQDVSHPHKDEQKHDVESVLEEIGALQLPTLNVMNKIDRLDNFEPRIDYNDSGIPVCVWISAQKGLGFDLLEKAIAELLSEEIVEGLLVVKNDMGKIRSSFHELGAVLNESLDNEGQWVMHLRLSRSALDSLLQQYQLPLTAWKLSPK